MSDFSVLVSGHSKEWRENLVAAFKQNGFEKVVSDDETDLMQLVRKIYPDVVLRRVDNHSEPIELVKELKSLSPFTIAIIIVDNPDYYDIQGLISYGVMGCLPIRLRPRQIVMAVELIVSAGILCLPRLSPRVFGHYQESSKDILHLLTAREKEILHMLRKNNSNQEMADELYLSISTVKTHLRSIFRKLGLRSRREALVLLNELDLPDKNEAIRPLSTNININTDRAADESVKLRIIKK